MAFKIGNDRRRLRPKPCRLLYPSSSILRSTRSITRDCGIPRSSKVCGTLGANVREVRASTGDIRNPHQTYRQLGKTSLEASTPRTAETSNISGEDMPIHSFSLPGARRDGYCRRSERFPED